MAPPGVTQPLSPVCTRNPPYHALVAAIAILLIVGFFAFLAFAPEPAIQIMVLGLWVLAALSIVLALVEPVMWVLARL